MKKKIKISSDYFEYKVEKKGITIAGYKGKIKDVVIPAKIDGLPVVAIGEFAFRNNKLTNVVIPDSVETIGDWAFYDNKLTNIVIPNTVKTIGDLAFDDNVKIIRE